MVKYFRLKMHARTSSLLTILSCTFQLSSLLTSTCDYYAAKCCQLGVSLAYRSCQLGASLIWSQFRICLIMIDCWLQLTILTYAHLYQVKAFTLERPLNKWIEIILSFPEIAWETHCYPQDSDGISWSSLGTLFFSPKFYSLRFIVYSLEQEISIPLQITDKKYFSKGLGNYCTFSIQPFKL